MQNFRIVSKLGEGAYSTVYKVQRYADGLYYALKKVKLLNLNDKEKENAMNEIQILCSVKDFNIINFKEVFIDSANSTLNIVMEFCDGGDLYEKISKHKENGYFIKEREIWNIFIQVTKGLKNLHDKKIFHRDLKSANIFLNKDGTVKLGDMNVSKISKNGFLKTQTGTPYYASPELWKDNPYNQKSDIWSLGCVLYEMATLEPPFQADDMEGLYRKIIRGSVQKIPSHYSKELEKMIKFLLQTTPTLRPSCAKILTSPNVLSRLEGNHLIFSEEETDILCRTLKFEKNLENLQQKLPKNNYEKLKIRMIDKEDFPMEILKKTDEEFSPKDKMPKLKVNKKKKEKTKTVRKIKLPKIEKPRNARSLSIGRSNRDSSNIDDLKAVLQRAQHYPIFKERIPEILDLYNVVRKSELLNNDTSIDSLEENLDDIIQLEQRLKKKEKNNIREKEKEREKELFDANKLKASYKMKRLKALEKAYAINIERVCDKSLLEDLKNKIC